MDGRTCVQFSWKLIGDFAAASWVNVHATIHGDYNKILIVLTLTLLLYIYRAKRPVKVHVWGGISCRGRFFVLLQGLWTDFYTPRF